MELSGYALKPLREDEESILFRGRHGPADRATILLLAPVSARPAPETLKKFEHAYSLRSELDASWAARPLAISEYNEQRVLVLEDPGGEPLNRLIHGPMEIKQFLRFAVGVATALSRLHQRQLIHEDLRPANILVDSATGHAWLTGFGIASRVPREHQPPEPPELIAGTLPYMAPEQTGPMNRSIDSRSDLYSLGITLYEMLTGGLPFTASDPMEWVHCHIARQPVPPIERLPAVPASVSAIIMKLLAKTAEERYQTAAGAESDLRRCLAEWETQGRINEFPPGQQDTPDRLLIPERLHGRAREIDTLLTDRSVEQLDLATVIKVSQAVSGEMVLEKLIDTLMRTAIEPAGAERGLLILPQGDEQRIEAEAIISEDTVIVYREEAAQGAWPESIVHYVMRTNECVILDDAAADHSFSADTYIRRHQVRSVLCLPLIHQAKLIGVLYLENILTSRAFTPKRVAVLKLLASQAAISLENARLYVDLREREAKIRRLVDANIIGICIWNIEGDIIEANDAFLKIVGYDRESFTSAPMRWTEMTPPEWRDNDARVIAELKAKGTTKPFEKELFRKDGIRVPILVGAALLQTGGNEGVAFVLDLSQQKRSEESYRVVVETANDAVISADENGTILLANPATERVFGYDPAELIGRPLTTLMPEYLRKLHEVGFKRYLETGRRHLNWQGTELVGLRKNGQEFPLEVSFGELTRDAHHVFTAFIRDISDRKRAEEALRRTESYLTQAQRLAHMGSWVWQVAGRKALYLSEEWYRIYGLDQQDGMPPWEERLRRIHPEDRAKWQGAIERAIAEKSDYDVEFRIVLSPDAPVRYIHTLGHPVLDQSGELVQFVGVSMDVTERKQAEETFRLIVVGTAATTGSDFFQSLVQHMAQALRARYAFVTTCDDQKHARSLAFWNGDGFGENFEFDIADTPCQKVLHGEVCSYRQGMQGLFPHDKILADWQAESYLGIPMLDRSNRVIGHIAILDDKPMETDLHTIDVLKIFASRAAAELKRQKAEDELQAALLERERLRRAQADLAHINRVSTLGELTASLAHEIKQPIAAAVLNAKTCLRCLAQAQPEWEDARGAASRLVKDVTRASEIISRIGSLFKKDVLQSELVDINELIREMIALLRSEAARYSISIHGVLEKDLPQIMADRVQIQQVLMNLMLNGIEAMREMNSQGQLTITSRRDENRQLLISVADTGVGLEPGQEEKIFNAFFTSKRQGTGMGLPISRSIVESHGGRLWAGQKFGPGATFQFTLPLTANAYRAS